jgi:predicted HicB family RNase H-like nuclease
MALPMAETEPPADTRVTTQLRIEADLWHRARELARKKRMSANSYACAAIEAAVRADEKALREQ